MTGVQTCALPIFIAILLIYTHRKNIERLKAGTESKTYIWKPRRIHPAGAAPGKDAAPEDAPSGAGQAPDKREK